MDNKHLLERVYVGNFSAVGPEYSRYMTCSDCNVAWTGCWDNFECPKCGQGELPSCDTLLTLEPILTAAQLQERAE